MVCRILTFLWSFVPVVRAVWVVEGFYKDHTGDYTSPAGTGYPLKRCTFEAFPTGTNDQQHRRDFRTAGRPQEISEV